LTTNWRGKSSVVGRHACGRPECILQYKRQPDTQAEAGKKEKGSSVTNSRRKWILPRIKESQLVQAPNLKEPRRDAADADGDL